MSIEIKHCPFRNEKEDYNVDCELTSCAWYDWINNQCAILTIALKMR